MSFWLGASGAEKLCALGARGGRFRAATSTSPLAGTHGPQRSARSGNCS
jgi:hypothetical protein